MRHTLADALPDDGVAAGVLGHARPGAGQTAKYRRHNPELYRKPLSVAVTAMLTAEAEVLPFQRKAAKK